MDPFRTVLGTETLGIRVVCTSNRTSVVLKWSGIFNNYTKSCRRGGGLRIKILVPSTPTINIIINVAAVVSIVIRVGVRVRIPCRSNF